MPISSYKVDNILRQYTRQVLPPSSRPQDVAKPEEKRQAADSVSISEEGLKRMRSRFQNEVLDYLRTKY
jgi:hypothetical protein